jgi:hypothetical protein
VINLHFPKFDWINEIQPIKQGLATMLTMFGAAAIVAALVMLYALLLFAFMMPESYLLLVSGLLILVTALLVRISAEAAAGDSRPSTATDRFGALNYDFLFFRHGQLQYAARRLAEAAGERAVSIGAALRAGSFDYDISGDERLVLSSPPSPGRCPARQPYSLRS